MLLKNFRKGASVEDTRLNYTKEWVMVRTRGGLCLINDTTFLLFSRIEILVKTYLPVTAHSLAYIDIRLLILEPALKDRDLLKLWDQLVPNKLKEDTSLAILQLVIDFYTQVRGFSFSNSLWKSTR